MKKLLTMILLLLVAFVVTAVAQDSTANVGGAGGSWISKNYELIAIIAYAIYEVLVRYIPTVSNWSLLSWIMKFIQVIVPNFKVSQNTSRKETHE